MKTRNIISTSALVLGLLMLSTMAIAFAGDPMPNAGAACCPVLYTYADGSFLREGHLSLNLTEGTITYYLHYNPDYMFFYKFQLTEENGTSFIDWLQLKVTYSNGIEAQLPVLYVECPDIFATAKLFSSDNWRFELNCGQTITVYFLALPFQISGETRITIEGYSTY